jgi:AraC family transcriptional regulator
MQGPPLVTEDRGAKSGARIDELLRTELVALGRFRCPPGDPLWSAENYIGEHAHVAFPHVPVRIALRGRADVVSDATLALCYAPRQRFRREALTARGDECVFAVLDGTLFDQIGPEPFRALPADGFLRVHALDDPLALEELIVGLAGAPAPRTTRWSERVKEVLAERLGDRLTLSQMARELGTSPYHLARAFKAATGSSIHQYRIQLRVRTALLRLREDVDLCTLGLDLGFATHSHFTETFRRVFGLPPRAVRELLSARIR